MKEDKIKHLEFIQNVITRMNTNSFQIKGLTITIVSAIMAIYVSTNDAIIILITIFPIFLFWFLDTYYLMQERKYRDLYNEVIKENSNIQLFEMNISQFQIGRLAYFKVFLSKTIFPLYFLILLISIFIFLFAN